MALNINTDIKTTYDYVPLSERDDKTPFTVTIRRLPIKILTEIQDAAITIRESGGYEYNVNKQVLTALEYGLVGWDNITDGKKPIKFRIVNGKADVETLEYLPEDLRVEIGNVILAITRDPNNAEEILKA